MNFGNRIGDLQQSSAVQATETANARPKAAVSSGASNVKQDDETTLSPASGLVAQALSQSDVRADKIAALQRSINDGSYSVSSSVVADKLMESMGE